MTGIEHPSWSDEESFWVGAAPLMYDQQRLARAAREVDEITALLGIDSPRRVLDLCCGPGRHVVELARRGHDVVGVDRTAAYVHTAREAARAAGVTPELIRSDAREYVCRPPVDVVLNLWTSFGYFPDPADNLLMLKNARASLADGGVLMLQTRSRETYLGHHPSPRTWEERDGILLLEESWVLDDWRRVAGRWVLVDAAGRRDYPWMAWLYTGDNLAELLVEAGFGSVELYGSFTGRPYDRDAKYLVAVARA